MTTPQPPPARVTLVLLVEDEPTTLYLWAHLSVGALIDELWANGVAAALIRVTITGSERYPS
jgi:hypothetical protein